MSEYEREHAEASEDLKHDKQPRWNLAGLPDFGRRHSMLGVVRTHVAATGCLKFFLNLFSTSSLRIALQIFHHSTCHNRPSHIAVRCRAGCPLMHANLSAEARTPEAFLNLNVTVLVVQVQVASFTIP